jgi:hypothetical protein
VAVFIREAGYQDRCTRDMEHIVRPGRSLPHTQCVTVRRGAHPHFPIL